MEFSPGSPLHPDPQTRRFYVDAMARLDDAGVPYLVGGGYALAYHSGVVRHTKDLDVFVRPEDSCRTLEVLREAGYRIEVTFSYWLAKALHGDAFIDVLYNSGNGLCPIDEDWFNHAVEGEVLGYRTRLCPPEEMLWSKAFVQARDRFDGPDIEHLILAAGQRFDWERLLRRFQGHEPVLLVHLLMFGYIYPTERDRIPGWVMDRLIESARTAPPTDQRICRGPFLDHKQYAFDILQWGFADARLQPHGPLTEREVSQLPAA